MTTWRLTLALAGAALSAHANLARMTEPTDLEIRPRRLIPGEELQHPVRIDGLVVRSTPKPRPRKDPCCGVRGCGGNESLEPWDVTRDRLWYLNRLPTATVRRLRTDLHLEGWPPYPGRTR